MTVVCAPFVFSFLFIDDLHPFLEPDLLGNLFHLVLIARICHPWIKARKMSGVSIKRMYVARATAEKGKSVVEGISSVV